jgi:hypothetical protein
MSLFFFFGMNKFKTQEFFGKIWKNLSFAKPTKQGFLREFSKKSKAQGTIEYLVIIAIVVVIGLAVVSLVVGLVDADGVSYSVDKASNWSNTLALTETSVTTDGNYLVRLVNNDSDPVTITNVSIGGEDADYSEDLFMSSGQNFVISSSDVCDEGGKLANDVVITYVTKHGLVKTERYPANTYFECQDYSVTFLADQCDKGYSFLASGQTSCWEGSSKTSCPVSGFPGQDGDAYGYSISLTSNGDGTISDSSGLMWQEGHQADLNWQEALQYCDDLSLAGHRDWRLPAFGEIWHTYDYENGYSADLVGGGDAFSDWAIGSRYWTSTTYRLSGGAAYNMYATSGIISYLNKSNDYYARCVRFED